MKTRTTYSPTEIDAALTVLAFYGGNSARASQETGVSDDTLRAWRLYTHRERYQQIVKERGKELEDLAVTHAREIMLRAGQTEHRILDALEDATKPLEIDGVQEPIDSKRVSELAGAFQRVTTAKGINTDKMLTLTDRPIGYIEHRDPGDTVNQLARKLGIVLDGTATDLPALNPAHPLITESNKANARGSQLAVSNPSVSKPTD